MQSKLRLRLTLLCASALITSCNGGGDGGGSSGVSEARAAEATSTGSQGGSQSNAGGGVVPVYLPVGASAAAADGRDGQVVGAVNLHERSGRTGTGAVVTFGYAFQRGAVPRRIVARAGTAELPTQFEAKTRHGDGSVKFAIVSTVAPTLEAGAAVRVDLVTASAGGGDRSAPASAALRAGLNPTVEITDGGVTYSLSVADVGGAGDAWLDGQLVQELRFGGVPRSTAGAPHPSVAVIFDVRAFAADSARVSVTVENVYGDARGNRRYDVRVRLGNGSAPVYSASGIEHYFSSRWRMSFDWGGTGSRVLAVPHWRPLADAGAIPTYDPSAAPSAAAVSDMLQRWSGAPRGLMQVGLLAPYMPTGGGRSEIGLLPGWAAMALLSGDPRLHEVVLASGELAGSWSIHLRKRASGRIYSIDDHPTMTLNTAAAAYSTAADRLSDCSGCSTPYTVDVAHQPSLAYLPYLLTGDRFFWDELKFWANFNFLDMHFEYRNRAEGLISQRALDGVTQSRAEAWALRTLSGAVWLAPEGDPDAAYFAAKLNGNIAWYRDNAVNSNPLGWWGRSAIASTISSSGAPYSADVTYLTAPWASDFMVAVFDWMLRMGYGESRAMRDWLARGLVNRFTSTDFNPMDGASYFLAIAGRAGPYTSWGQVHANSFANRSTPAPTALQDASCGECYPVIALAALAGAVRDGLPGANAARAFLTAQIPQARVYSGNPTWAVVP